MDDLSQMSTDELRRVVEENAARVAEQGAWPETRDPKKMPMNIPRGDTKAEGLDAGLACALDLIPRDKQALAASLYGAFTLERVEQVRREVILRLEQSEDIDPDCESVWWLMATFFCSKGVNEAEFREQLAGFEKTAENPDARLDAVWEKYMDIMESFQILADGTPFSNRHNGLLAAYMDGHPWAAYYSSEFGVFFVGTLHPSLGLERFRWSSHADAVNGPVNGSSQFVMCATPDELARALAIVRKHFAG